jgi:NitT/TauT family transport system ATP-binding protein
LVTWKSSWTWTSSVAAHGRIGVIGPRGCGKGKFTPPSLIAGLVEFTTGQVRVGDADTPEGRLAACALMPQKDLLLP